jgi:hypothetical protein
LTEASKTGADIPDEGAMFARAGNVADNLDEVLGRCLEPLGFTADSASRIKGVYRATIEGRRIRVNPIVRSRNRYATPDVSYRVYDGFSLEFAVETSRQTRLAVSYPPRGSGTTISSFKASRQR